MSRNYFCYVLFYFHVIIFVKAFAANTALLQTLIYFIDNDMDMLAKSKLRENYL